MEVTELSSDESGEVIETTRDKYEYEHEEEDDDDVVPFEPERVVNSRRPVEEIVLDDDDDEEEDDDDIVVEMENVLTEEERTELRIQRADKMLSWFVKMKPEYIDKCIIQSPDYIETYIQDDLAIKIETCRQILDEFQKNGDIDQVAEKLSIESVQLAIVGLCVATLDECNSRNINFSNLIDDRIDEWSYGEAKKFMDLKDAGIEKNTRYGPNELMKQLIAPPAFTVLALTILWLKDNNYPCQLEWVRTETFKCKSEEICQLEDEIPELALEFWKGNVNVEDTAGNLTRDLERVMKDLDVIGPAIQDEFQRVQLAKQEISVGRMKKIQKEIELKDMDHVDLLTDEEKLAMQNNISTLESLKTELEDYTKKIEESQNSSKTLHEALVLWTGEFCLARTDAFDNVELQLAIVEKQLTAVSYRVKFVHSEISENVHIRDIAYPRYGMMDPLVVHTTYVGLRVACLYKYQVAGARMNEIEDRSMWLSGTIGGRSASHGDEFLVFLDNGEDIYVDAPYNVLSKNVSKIYQIPATTTDPEKMRERLTMIKMVPMLAQTFNESAHLDKTQVHSLIRDRIRSRFIQTFMYKYPEWPLLRVNVGSQITVLHKDTRQKIVVTVVNLDRAFCVIRHVQSNMLAGSGCTVYPCKLAHPHIDETIYRGSYRIPDIMLDRSADNNLSKRSRDKLRRQFDTTEPERRMPIPGESGLVSTIEQQKAARKQGKNARSKGSSVSNSELAERKKKQNYMVKTTKETPILEALKDLKYHSKCGSECLKSMDTDPYDSRFHTCSPLHVPLLCGWRRYKFTFKTFKKRTTTSRRILYYGPCGKPLATMKNIVTYLRETRSMITIDCFSFDGDVDTETYITVDPKFVMKADFTDGMEGIPIPAVNTIDMELPPKIEYTKRRYQYDASVDIDTINRDFCSGCTCEGDCSDASRCECQQLTSTSYNRLPTVLTWPNKKFQGLYDYRLLSDKVYSGIYECNDQCSCHRKNCHNRVVQNNIKWPMQIFKTAESGWGVRALTDIPKGAYLCTYVGALLTNELADQLENEDQYFADLDLKDVVEKEKMIIDTEGDHGFESDEETEEEQVESEEEQKDDGIGSDEGANSMNSEDASNLRRSARQTERKKAEKKEKSEKKEEKERRRKIRNENMFKWDDYFNKSALFVVDAKQRGNVGRFLNHSCDPNVHVQHVLYDTHDLRLPWVAFFTVKSVKAGDELCWDYNYTFTKDDEEQIQCKCGSEICRGRLL